VGSFLVRQGNSNQILIGTGDPGRWGDSGSGLYRTSDGGASWTRIALNPEPANYYKLVADPSDSSGARVYAATSEGVFISHDFGQTWGASYDGPTAMGVTDIVRPAAGSNWYLGVPGEGVVTCTVLTTTFTACTAGTGFGPDIERVSIAISPANTSWIFALVNGAGHWDYTIYRSSDGGATFIDMDPRFSGDAMAWGQNFHTHAIAVDPASPNRVIVGLAAAQMTLNATAANPNDICWHRNVGVTGSGCDTTGLDAGHVDQTSMAFIPQNLAPGNTEILITNDGGIYTYDWAADTHDDRFNEWGLNISQTYNAPTFDLSLSDPNRALAGLQDNGIVQISRDATSDKYRYLFGADGGAVSIMPGNSDRFAVTNGMAYNRYNWWDGGPQVGMNWEDRTPSGSFVPDEPAGGWVFADRSTAHADYVTMATGGHRPSRIFLSPSRGAHWWDVTGDLADALPNVSYWQLVVHPSDHQQLFLATEVGVFRSDDSGGHWYRYMDGLPSVVKVRGIQIHATGFDGAEMVIATWGHGFWERTVEFQEGALFGDGFETGSTGRWDGTVGGAP
jgi:hypothetical protein